MPAQDGRRSDNFALPSLIPARAGKHFFSVLGKLPLLRGGPATARSADGYDPWPASMAYRQSNRDCAARP